jgi:hypothetical protein
VCYGRILLTLPKSYVYVYLNPNCYIVQVINALFHAAKYLKTTSIISLSLLLTRDLSKRDDACGEVTLYSKI